jgi:hypothetical protein
MRCAWLLVSMDLGIGKGVICVCRNREIHMDRNMDEMSRSFDEFHLYKRDEMSSVFKRPRYVEAGEERRRLLRISH